MTLMKPCLSCLFLCLLLGAVPHTWAGEVWQWTDERGETHLGNVPPEGGSTTLIYNEAEGRIFQWQDETGGVHFSDVPPGESPATGLREIVIEPVETSDVDPAEYSIVRQARRLAESNRELEQARVEKKYTRLEERRIARELELLRMEEQIRTRGYGPRPWMYPYARRYGAYY